MNTNNLENIHDGALHTITGGAGDRNTVSGGDGDAPSDRYNPPPPCWRVPNLLRPEKTMTICGWDAVPFRGF